MEVLIEKLDHQGRGITHVDGKIIFVEHALPEEIVDIDIINEKKNYSEAIIKKIIKRSKKRIDSVCPYFETCGGCDLLHLDYNEQLKYKETKVREIVKKYGNIDENKVIDIVPSPKQYNYRNKITLKNNGKVGYHKRRTNEVINIDKCLLANDSINETISKLNTEKIESNILEIMIRDINEKEKVMMLTLQDEKIIDKNYDRYYGICKNTVFLTKKNGLITTNKGNIIGNLGGKSYEVSPTAFFQVNTEQTVNLYNIILQEVKKIKDSCVLDLYCGTGTIGIYISDYAKEIIGVEINQSSIDNANRNKVRNNVKNISFMVGDTKKFLNKNNKKADLVIVDPPRAGLDKEVIEDLIKINAHEIIYVSCDPITLARDLKLFNVAYDIEKIVPFDMFPNTFHVENFCIMKKRRNEV